MVIVRARPEHIPAVAALERICFPADPWPEALFSRLIGRVFVAAEGDAVLGYIVFSTVLDEGGIDNIAVAPEHRRRGIAGSLVAHALDNARAENLSFITLEVRASNEAAIALYEQYGFREVGRRRNYYEKPREDAILMTLVL